MSRETRLVRYGTCEDLEADIKSMLIAEMETYFDQLEHGGWGRGGGGGAEDGSAPPTADPASGGGGRQEGEDYSGTNNQETGVDEADFVKTDGYHVFVLNGNRLHIFGAPEFGDLDPLSETQLEGEPREMLIHAGQAKVAIFSHVYPESLPPEHPLFAVLGASVHGERYWRSGLVSKLTVLDVIDPAEPKLERELFFEGYYQTARLVDTSVRLGAYSWLNIPGVWDYYHYYWEAGENLVLAKLLARQAIQALALDDLVPRIYERAPSGELTTHGITDQSCRGFYRPENSRARGITSIMSFDLAVDGFELDADHIVSNWPTIYASQDTLVVAEPANDWWWFWWNEANPEQLNVHTFDTSTPGETVYLASGRVEGLLHNQFSLDEEDGYLRVATTVNFWNRWWMENPPLADNRVYVLAQQGDTLATVGELDGIAPGERIFAARMVGDRGYLVTFEQTDPLFTLDLRDPTHPTVEGELEIPGFSIYIHPIADDKLLTIGVGGDDTGANWRTQISMFDVSDYQHPALTDVEELVRDGSWGWSEAMYEHKAFQYFAPKGLLAVPLASDRYSEGGGWDYVSTLELISIDTATGLARYGTIDHSHLYGSDPERWWYFTDIRRSIFMGDYVYALSDGGITVHQLDGLAKVNEQRLPGYSPGDYYWWW
jgi:hypothetical protein